LTNITAKTRGNSKMLLNQDNSRKEVETLPVVSLTEYDPHDDFLSEITELSLTATAQHRN